MGPQEKTTTRTDEANVENNLSLGDHLLAKFIPPLINHIDLKDTKLIDEN